MSAPPPNVSAPQGPSRSDRVRVYIARYLATAAAAWSLSTFLSPLMVAEMPVFQDRSANGWEVISVAASTGASNMVKAAVPAVQKKVNEIAQEAVKAVQRQTLHAMDTTGALEKASGLTESTRTASATPNPIAEGKSDTDAHPTEAPFVVRWMGLVPGMFALAYVTALLALASGLRGGKAAHLWCALGAIATAAACGQIFAFNASKREFVSAVLAQTSHSGFPLFSWVGRFLSQLASPTVDIRPGSGAWVLLGSLSLGALLILIHPPRRAVTPAFVTAPAPPPVAAAPSTPPPPLPGESS